MANTRTGLLTQCKCKSLFTKKRSATAKYKRKYHASRNFATKLHSPHHIFVSERILKTYNHGNRKL